MKRVSGYYFLKFKTENNYHVIGQYQLLGEECGYERMSNSWYFMGIDGPFSEKAITEDFDIGPKVEFPGVNLKDLEKP